MLHTKGMKEFTQKINQPQVVAKTERSLVLVDLENFARGSEHVGRHSKSIRQLVDQFSRDGVDQFRIVATGKRASEKDPGIFWDWSDSRFLIGAGIDGADRKLLQVLEDEPLCDSITEVQIWSGDHCFAPITRRLRLSGKQVNIFTIRKAASHELCRAASKVHLFEWESIEAPSSETLDHLVA